MLQQKRTATKLEDAVAFSKEFGFPVEIRPWFTLGSTGTSIANNPEDLEKYFERALRLSPVGQVTLIKV